MVGQESELGLQGLAVYSGTDGSDTATQSQYVHCDASSVSRGPVAFFEVWKQIEIVGYKLIKIIQILKIKRALSHLPIPTFPKESTYWESSRLLRGAAVAPSSYSAVSE